MNNNLHENFKIVLEYFKKNNSGYSGICAYISCSIHPRKQRDLTEKFFKKNKPSFFRFRKFYLHPCYSGRAFWWGGSVSLSHIGEDHQCCRNQRILFLEELIKLTAPVVWYKEPLRWLRQMV